MKIMGEDVSNAMAALLIAVTCCFATKAASPTNTASAAVEKARQYTGFTESRAIEAEIKSPVSVKALPFLSGHLASDRTWHILFQSITFEDSEKESDHGSSFTASVLIDDVTSQLITVDAVREPNSAHSQSQTTITSEEDDLRKIGERYTGLPSKPPAITLSRAIGILGNGHFATGLHAVYVLDSTTSNPKPHAIWSIILYGLPPIQPKGGDPRYVNTQTQPLRFGVDAVTGEELFMTNVL